ncbi:hypothetical protein BX666DRAFT_2030695 [Dichotomocladium elegans]|nr:hypothetical protein BX666DRAFT_2030695 [Dichotomocladium elegans]
MACEIPDLATIAHYDDYHQLDGQANSSAKKQAISNTRILDNLRKGFAVVHLSFLIWRAGYHWATFTTSQMILYVLTSGLSIFLYSTLESSGRPRYDATGTLISAGDDMNAEGLTAYMFDIIYVTWFTQVMVAFVSSKFWYTYLVIPAYASYKLGPMAWSFLRRSSAASRDAPPEAAKSKRQQKMEKRGNKGQVKYVR